MTHPLLKRQEFIDVPCTHSFVTYDVGHAQLPHQVLTDGYVMTDDGNVFPVEMSQPEMEWFKKSMILTGSVFTKHESLYELGDGTTMFTFLVKKTEPSPGWWHGQRRCTGQD